MLLAENNGNTVEVNFIKSTFETGKSEYHCNMKIVDKLGELNIHYTLKPVAGALMIAGKFNNAYYYNKPNWTDNFYLFDGFNISSASWQDFNVTYTSEDVGGHSYTILSASSIGIAGNMVGLPPNNVTITIDADFPIFAMDSTTTADGTGGSYVRFSNTNFNTYENELKLGDMTHADLAENYKNVVNEIPTNKVWDIINYLKVDGTITTTKAYCFKILPEAKIGLYVTDQVEGDGSPNMVLRISDYPCLTKGFYQPDSAYVQSSNVDSDYWWGEWQDYSNGTSYVGYGATNIPIFRSETDLQKYFDGELGIEDSINGGGSSIKTSTIGDDLQSTDIPTVNLATSGVGCYIYALSESQIKDLMSNYLYVTDATLLQNISEALWLWGNNPIDFFIDCYYIPFDITNFYTTNNADMKFGTYRFESTQGWSTFPVVQETNGTRLTLFDTTFEGIYGDWRDYKQFDYDLFLPFYGFFRLDLFKYLNKRIKCEMMFDVTTHNLRYYLYADGVITDRIDSSVGINLPLMSSDMVNKAKSDRLAEREQRKTYVGLGASVASGTVGVVAGLASGSVFTAVNSGTNAINTIIDSKYNLEALSDSINSNMTESVNGSFSGSMNIYDIRYAYLRITERELIIPDQLHELYNYPSYYMGSASELSGYCEISDIRLQSFTGTIEELNALKSALREGVIF